MLVERSRFCYKRRMLDAGFDLVRTYVRLNDAGRAIATEGGDSYWSAVDPSTESGHLVAVFEVPSGAEMGWEIHPRGDEFLYLLSGAMEVVIREDGQRDRTIRLSPGRGCIVPQDCWHRQIVSLSSELLAITPTHGTAHRAEP